MSNTTGEKEMFTFSYTFNAPKKMVFQAFGDAEALNEWWGPVDSRNTVISLDFRPGGTFHFKMETGGRTSYGRFLFYTITPYDFLEFSNAFADEQGQVVRAPFDMPFPQEIVYSLRFIDDGDRTTIMMTGVPLKATATEIQSFLSINASMEEGFGATFAQLSVFLDQQRAS